MTARFLYADAASDADAACGADAAYSTLEYDLNVLSSMEWEHTGTTVKTIPGSTF